MIKITLALFTVTLCSFFLDGYGSTKLLVLVALALLCLGLAGVVRDRRLGIVNPFSIFTISFLQYYIVPPLDTVYFHRYMSLATVIYGHIPPDADGPLVRGLATSIIGLAGVIVGYQSLLWACGETPPRRPAGDWVIDRHRLMLVASTAVLVSIVAYIAFLGHIGFSTYLDTPRELRAYFFHQIGGLTIAFNFWEVAIVLFSVAHIESNRHNLRRAIVLIVVLFIPPTFLLLGFLSGSRILILRPALIIGFYLMLTTGNTRLSLRIGIVFAVAIFIAVVGGIFRRYVGVDFDALLKEAPHFLDPKYAYAIVTQSLDYPATHDIYLLLHERRFHLGYGSTYLKLIYQFIPREFWPGKPENITVIAAQIFRPDLWLEGVSYAPTMFGEMYYNFGNWGVATMCLFVGILFAWLTRFGLRAGHNPPLTLIYAALTFSILEQARGGFSDTSDTYLIYYILPVLLVARRRASLSRPVVTDVAAATS